MTVELMSFVSRSTLSNQDAHHTHALLPFSFHMMDNIDEGHNTLKNINELTKSLDELLHDQFPHGTFFLDPDETAFFIVLPAQKPKMCQFSYKEWQLFSTLLSTYPYSASFEELYASVSSWSIQECAEHLRAIKRQGKSLKDELAPLYDGIRSIRQKLKPFHLDIHSVRTQGYLLGPLAGPVSARPHHGGHRPTPSIAQTDLCLRRNSSCS
jgi:hypothetical protein